MTDTGYGIYVSVRNVDGVLVSTNRATVEEVLADIPGLNEILAQFDTTANVEQAMANVVSIMEPEVPSDYHNAHEIAATGPATNQFEPCNVCGGPKNRWVAPGVSKKTGKPYPGFFGCPTNHR